MNRLTQRQGRLLPIHTRGSHFWVCLALLLMFTGCIPERADAPSSQVTSAEHRQAEKTHPIAPQPGVNASGANQKTLASPAPHAAAKLKSRMTTREFYHLIHGDDVAARQRYQGATLEITGKVVDRELDLAPAPYIALQAEPTPEFQFDLLTVYCQVSNSTVLTQVSKRQRATLRGVLKENALTQCTVIAAEGAPTLTYTSEEFIAQYLLNPERAEDEWAGRNIIVTGKVAKTGADEKFGSSYISTLLEGTDGILLPVHHVPISPAFEKIKPGDDVRILGEVGVERSDDEKYHIGVEWGQLLDHRPAR